MPKAMRLVCCLATGCRDVNHNMHAQFVDMSLCTSYLCMHCWWIAAGELISVEKKISTDVWFGFSWTWHLMVFLKLHSSDGFSLAEICRKIFFSTDLLAATVYTRCRPSISAQQRSVEKKFFQQISWLPLCKPVAGPVFRSVELDLIRRFFYG